ncbi:hypothetical protein ALMP_42710 [Streptomyces sp. A012304]|nr:hypothetical protein ALMP_42710 [Streptomyces sp. A012304]
MLVNTPAAVAARYVAYLLKPPTATAAYNRTEPTAPVLPGRPTPKRRSVLRGHRRVPRVFRRSRGTPQSPADDTSTVTPCHDP